MKMATGQNITVIGVLQRVHGRKSPESRRSQQSLLHALSERERSWLRAPCDLLMSRRQDDVAKDHAIELAVQVDERLVQFEQNTARQFERVLVRLIDGAARVIDKRCARLLDVRAENVCDRFVLGEVDQALVAGDECRKLRVSDVK